MSRVTAKQKLDAWASTPFVNINKTAANITLTLHQKQLAAKLNSLDWMRRIFGRQNYCWTERHRYWVWEIGHVRVFANPIRGISYEVKESLPPKEQIKAIQTFAERLVTRLDPATLVNGYRA